jgi:hypothetical protein
MSDQPTRPSGETRAEEERDAQVKAGADKVEGPDADDRADVSDEVAENYEAALERGANQKGEGRLP